MTIRSRLNIPALPQRDQPSPSIFNATFSPIVEDVNPSLDSQQPESDDFLGVVESPFASPKFQRNFTQQGGGFTGFGRDPFHLYATTPFDPVLPSDAKYNDKWKKKKKKLLAI